MKPFQVFESVEAFSDWIQEMWHDDLRLIASDRKIWYVDAFQVANHIAREDWCKECIEFDGSYNINTLGSGWREKVPN